MSEPQKVCLFPTKLQFLFKPARYKVAYGGRGGAKSWGFARALIYIARRTPIRVLCAREYQNSILESVHRLLAEQIDAMGMQDFFIVKKTNIEGINGSNFFFEGLHNNVMR